MQSLAGFGRNVGAAALVLIGAIGAGACVTVRVDDLRVEQLRRVGAKEGAGLPPSLQTYVNDSSYRHGDMVEATLSTERDLVELMERDETWTLTVTATRCEPPLTDASLRLDPSLYSDKLPVGAPSAFGFGKVVAHSENAKPTNGRHFYTFYFSSREVAYPLSQAMVYDLAAAPFDVCVNIDAVAYMRAIEIVSNTVKISQAEFRQLFSPR